MATGDNILTAICVSKECNLIEQNQEMVACEIENENGIDCLKWRKLDDISNNDDNNNNNTTQNELIDNSVGNPLNKDIETNTVNSIQKSLIENATTSKTLHDLFPPDDVNKASNAMKKEPQKKHKIVPKKTNNLQNSKLILSKTLSVASIKSRDSALNLMIEDFDPGSLCKDDNYGIAITGPVFEKLSYLSDRYLKKKRPALRPAREAFRLILKNGRVFARMAPEHKALLVDALKAEGFTTLMCGDGANDCSALRTAHVSVSLSAEEASIAANFTSKNPDVSCIYELLREGKCSLTTSIQTFKYMMLYSMIQFFCVTLMLIYLTYLSDFQFLVSDLFIIFPLEWFLAMTKPYYQLTHHYPVSALLSFPVIISIAGHSAIVFAFQFGGYKILKNHYEWENICEFDDNDSPEPCHENTIYFLLSLFQYLGLAIAFFVSKPFRQRIYTNWLLMIYLAGVYFYSIWITINCDSWSKKLFKLYNLEERGDVEEEEEEGEDEDDDGEGEDNDKEEEETDTAFGASDEEDETDDIIPGGKNMKYYILIMAGVNTVVNILFEWVIMRLINYCYESLLIRKYRKEIENEITMKHNKIDNNEVKDVQIYKYQRVYYHDRRKNRKL